MKNITILIACTILVILAYSYLSRDDSKFKIQPAETVNDAGVTTATTSTTSGNQGGDVYTILSTETTSATSDNSNAPSASGKTETNSTLNTNKKNMNVTFKTNKGDIIIELFETKVPKTVANFKTLAESGYYDGVKFHRVIKGFMIQSGDPLTKDDSKMNSWGTGGPGYKFDDELVADNRNDIVTISMANAGPNTNGSQFFINVGSNNFLDGKHVVFGKVIKGMDVVTAIENVQTGQSDRPVSPVVIEKITF